MNKYLFMKTKNKKNLIIWAFLVLLSFFFFLHQLSFFYINGIDQAFPNVYTHYQPQRSLSSVVANDPDSAALNIKKLHRTGYHFQPQQHWINDPTGPMHYKGLYHLFYQYNPKGAVWGNIVWAHSVSKDMINWDSLEPAIYPSKPFDKYGCWSGSATMLPGDKPIILYTGVIHLEPKPGHQVQNYALPANYSDPYLREWIKPDDNPIISPVRGENVSQFRDPTTAWFENGHWNVLVGSVSRRNNRGIAHLYKSRDFKRWTKARYHFYSKAETGMWECLDFFPVAVHGTNGLDHTTSVALTDQKNVKHVLKVSLDLTRYDHYTLGTYDPINDKYVPDHDTSSLDGWSGSLRYDYGNFYASKTFYDPVKRRRILWGWANESDNANDDITKGWAGIQLIPRTLWLDPSGKQLLQWPIQELDSLRGEKVELSNIKLNPGHHREVEGLTAAQADVDVTFSFSSLDMAEPFDPSWAKLDALDVCSLRGSTVEGGLGPFGLLTLASNHLEEYTPVFYRVFKADQDLYKVLLCSDAKSSSLRKGLYKPSFAGYVDVDLADKKLSLRSLIDNSVVESFGAKGKTCISSRVYPTLAVFGNAHLHVFNNGSETITVERLEAWSMNKPDQMN